MVGRGLKRDVEGDGEAEALRFVAKALEGGHPAEFVGHVHVAALASVAQESANRPRAARLTLLGGEGAVFALAVLHADGVDGRQVHHVEPHLADARQAPGRIVERAVDGAPVRPRIRRGAGEELVPRGKGGQGMVYLHRLRSARDEPGARVGLGGERGERVVEGRGGVAALEALGVGGEGLAGGRAQCRAPRAQERRHVEQFGLDRAPPTRPRRGGGETARATSRRRRSTRGRGTSTGRGRRGQSGRCTRR